VIQEAFFAEEEPTLVYGDNRVPFYTALSVLEELSQASLDKAGQFRIISNPVSSSWMAALLREEDAGIPADGHG
jgi:hypothetical protein